MGLPSRNQFRLSRLPVLAEFEVRAMLAARSVLVMQLLVEPVVRFGILAVGIGTVVSATADSLNRDYLQFVLPGVVAMQSISAFTRAINRSTMDLRYGLAALKKIYGASPIAYVLSIVCASILALAVQSVVLGTMAAGFGVDVLLPDFLRMLGIGMLSLIMWVAGGVALSISIKDFQKRDTLIGVSLPFMTFAAPVFYAANSLPEYLQVAMMLNPLSYQVNAMRCAFNGELISGVDLAMMAVVTFLLILVCVIKWQSLETYGDH